VLAPSPDFVQWPNTLHSRASAIWHALHCNNLGLAGNVETALTTIAAAEGLPLHLAR
jgi:hypothetical protein